MGIDRRTFMKALGVTGIAFATPGKSLAGNENIEFNAVLYDASRCIGCQSCEISCAESHGLPAPTEVPVAGTERKLDESRRTLINAYSTSKGEIYNKKQCMHCNEPACASACLTQAMYKTHEGPVVWRGQKCMGCRYCMVSCPFDIPKFEYHSSNPGIIKCDMCYERQMEGQIPVCVENCPAEALLFGTRRELLKEARKRLTENPDLYTDYIYGEHEAGGTGFLQLSPVPFKELGLKTNLGKTSYPALSKGFLYAVPSIFILWPAILLGIREATKNNQITESENE